MFNDVSSIFFGTVQGTTKKYISPEEVENNGRNIAKYYYF